MLIEVDYIYEEENSVITEEKSLPRSSVEVDTSVLVVEVFLKSIDLPLEEAFRSLVCNSFFSADKQSRLLENVIWSVKLLQKITDSVIHWGDQRMNFENL